MVEGKPKSREELKQTLKRIDGKGYKFYRSLKGCYAWPKYLLYVDHVQSDPFAPPSRLRVRVPQKVAGFPKDTYHNKSREIALRDFLTRCFHDACKKFCGGKRGTGNSGLITIEKPGQEILERNSVIVNESFVEARFTAGLPAHGRRIDGKTAETMFSKEIPRIVEQSLIFQNLDGEKLYEHVEVAEDADYLRSRLEEMGLIAFVADGSILPRASGVDPRPMDRRLAVPFRSPESLRVKVELPNRGLVTGMGIPKGVTLIVGGGYHGKSTLLKALELGVYNHIPGDGRELVVTNPSAVKVRAEDGRRIEQVNLTPFISNLPRGQTTEAFSTENASGSTSQAANIIEALEMGAKVLLIDEDTSATNLMFRDRRMQELVPKDREPITTFIDKVRQLYLEKDVSTVIVVGSSGEYFDVADCVICMVEYVPYDLTREARKVAEKYPSERRQEGGESFGEVVSRIPLPQSFRFRRPGRKLKASVKGVHLARLGDHVLNLWALEQLVDIGQTRAIVDALVYAGKYADGKRSLREIVEQVLRDIEEKGLDVLSPKISGGYAAFRKFELAAAINRLPTLKVRLERKG